MSYRHFILETESSSWGAKFHAYCGALVEDILKNAEGNVNCMKCLHARANELYRRGDYARYERFRKEFGC